MLSAFFSITLSILACTGQSVDRQNAAPDASISSHFNGEEVYDGYTITLVGSATDTDNPNTDLVASWFVGGKEVCVETPAPDGATECEVTITDESDSSESDRGDLEPVHLGDGMVMLYVEDTEGAAGTATVTLVIIDISTPVVEISAPFADGAYYSDQLIEFAGVVSDEQDEAGDLTVWWESSLGDDMTGIDTGPNADGELTGLGYLSEGEHTIELYAEDLTGKVGSDSVIVYVGSATPPQSSSD
jgi:hypothetical protein